METVIKVAIGALIVGFGSIIFAIVIYFFLPLLGITAQPVSNDWGLVLSVIGGIIMFFLYLFFRFQTIHDLERKQDNAAFMRQIEAQNEEAAKQRESNTDMLKVMFDIKASLDSALERKSEAQSRKDGDQDGEINQIKHRVYLLEGKVIRIEDTIGEIKGKLVDLKKYIGDTIGDLRKAIEKSGL